VPFQQYQKVSRSGQHFGGPSWRLATEMMRDLKERSRRESIAEQMTRVVAEIAKAEPRERA
jgi:hypothetical protein